MPTFFYQRIHHINQRRSALFEVRRQEPQDTIVSRASIKKPEAAQEAFFVNPYVFYKMFAANRAGGSAALKNHYRGKIACFYRMRFIELYGEEWNLFEG